MTYNVFCGTLNPTLTNRQELKTFLYRLSFNERKVDFIYLYLTLLNLTQLSLQLCNVLLQCFHNSIP